jgi:DNA-binding NtrC family response regulator
MILQPTILLVEDEVFQRNSLSLMLQREGYRVTAVEDGLAALTQLESREFDIVLSDLRMPNLTGMDLLKEIKARGIKAEVILITAYGELRDAINALKAGAYDFIEKNRDTDEELKSAMRRALGSHY